MKKNRIWMILWLCFCLMMTGCVGKVVSQGEPAESAAPEALPEEQDPALKTGLCLMTSTEKSRSAGEENGAAAADVIMVAVTVDENERIHGCRIDSVSAEMTVSAEGEVLSQGGEIRSKKELGEEYGMEKASSIGKEWHEQIRALEEYAEGMTLGELRGIRLTEAGMLLRERAEDILSLPVGQQAAQRVQKVTDTRRLFAAAGAANIHGDDHARPGRAQGQPAINGLLDAMQGDIRCHDAMRGGAAFQQGQQT